MSNVSDNVKDKITENVIESNVYKKHSIVSDNTADIVALAIAKLHNEMAVAMMRFENKQISQEIYERTIKAITTELTTLKMEQTQMLARKDPSLLRAPENVGTYDGIDLTQVPSVADIDNWFKAKADGNLPRMPFLAPVTYRVYLTVKDNERVLADYLRYLDSRLTDIPTDR